MYGERTEWSGGAEIHAAVGAERLEGARSAAAWAGPRCNVPSRPGPPAKYRAAGWAGGSRARSARSESGSESSGASRRSAKRSGGWSPRTGTGAAGCAVLSTEMMRCESFAVPSTTTQAGARLALADASEPARRGTAGTGAVLNPRVEWLPLYAHPWRSRSFQPGSAETNTPYLFHRSS